MRAIFATDLMLAVLLWIATLVLLFSGFFLQADSLSSQLSIAEKERNAIFLADHLLYSCADEYGLAKCDDSFIHANEISDGGIDVLGNMRLNEIKEYFQMDDGKKLGISVKEVDAPAILRIGDLPETGQGVCIKRIAILREGGELGKPAVLEVCVI
ncbi:MAG: hypothetical protein V1835_05125 [Candidatus Micrarchaeota archaeon]